MARSSRRPDLSCAPAAICASYATPESAMARRRAAGEFLQARSTRLFNPDRLSGGIMSVI